MARHRLRAEVPQLLGVTLLVPQLLGVTLLGFLPFWRQTAWVLSNGAAATSVEFGLARSVVR